MDRSRHPDPNIVVVDFDDDTFAALKRFPVSRSVVADVIKVLRAIQGNWVGLPALGETISIGRRGP